MSPWISFKALQHILQVGTVIKHLGIYADHYSVDSKSTRRRQPGQDASHFKTDEDTGKMIIDADSDSEEAAVENAATDVAGTAYRESMVSVDGFIRGPNGKIKFHKDTKKRRREEEANQDVEMADAEEVAGSKPKKSKKKSEVSFGYEFKAKVYSFRL